MKLLVANLKMNIPTIPFDKYVDKVNGLCGVKILLALPFTELYLCKKMKKANIIGCAQDVFVGSTANTGKIGIEHLQLSGAQSVIIGHSEQRALGETDEDINQKVVHALSSGFEVVLCIGETLSQRKSGNTNLVITNQIRSALFSVKANYMSKVNIAYEPIWSIGSGVPAKVEYIESAIQVIRECLADMYPIIPNDKFGVLYGGSIDDTNAREFANIYGLDGLLVGSACKDFDKLKKIIKELK